MDNIFFGECVDMFKRTEEMISLLKEVANRSLKHFYYANPFSAGDYADYDGKLTSDIFFTEGLYVKPDQTDRFEKIKTAINSSMSNAILLFGMRGSGKTTLIHNLKHIYSSCSDNDFEILDFDAETRDPMVLVFCEKFAKVLIKRFRNDVKSNNLNGINSLYAMYQDHSDVIDDFSSIHIGKMQTFFAQLGRTYCSARFDPRKSKNSQSEFFDTFQNLPFPLLLTLLILWDVCEHSKSENKTKKTYCLDNIDSIAPRDEVMVFYKTLWNFIRDIGALIAELNNEAGFLKNKNGELLSFGQVYTFIICARDTTWAKVGRDSKALGDVRTDAQVGFFLKNILCIANVSHVYDKRLIARARHDWLEKQRAQVCCLANDSKLFLEILFALDRARRSSIFFLFNNDYRYCIDTLHKVVFESDVFGSDIGNVIKRDFRDVYSLSHNGARGLVRKGIFDFFQYEKFFTAMGVKDLSSEEETVTSIGRLILTYLSSFTNPREEANAIKVCDVVRDIRKFMPDITDEYIRRIISGMYGLKDDVWGHLVILTLDKQAEVSNIGTELPDTAQIQITEAGLEYLDFVATHFEFFSCRLKSKGIIHAPLFSTDNLSVKNNQYVFENIIEDVYSIVETCCIKLHKFIGEHILTAYDNIETFINQSPFIYEAIIRPFEDGER